MVGLDEDVGERFRRLLLDELMDEQGAQSQPQRRRARGIASEPQQLVVGIQYLARLLQRQLTELGRRRAAIAIDPVGNQQERTAALPAA